jgi:4-hydroxy-2-oxoheptanedioate aldolase
MRLNQLKAKLLAGQPALGVSLMFPSVPLVEMIGLLGFDWVLLDCEHGSLTPESVELMALAAEAAGMTPMARPASNSPEAILRLMDRGVMGVQVPHVNTVEQAQRAVAAVRFAPLGQRGLAAASRPARYGIGLNLADYVEWVNRETLVAVQIEEAEALTNLPALLTVAGVDVFFVGPSDLSQSLGYAGRAEAPVVQQAMADAFDRIRAAGRVAGTAGGTAATARAIGQGVHYLYTHLPTLLALGNGQFRAGLPRLQ